MTFRAYDVAVKHAGQTWTGHYQVRGATVSVSSAYGSKAGDLGRDEDPEAVAKRLMLEIAKGRG